MFLRKNAAFCKNADVGSFSYVLTETRLSQTLKGLEISL